MSKGDGVVYINERGRVYHAHRFCHPQGLQHPTTPEDAQKHGRRPCKRCYDG